MEEFIKAKKIILGQKFEQYRNLLGYTKAEFATLIALSPSTINNIEKGNGFNSNSLLLYSYYLGLNASEILDINVKLPEPKQFKADFDKKAEEINPIDFKKVRDARKTLKNIIEQLASDKLYFKSGKIVDVVRKDLKSEFDKDYESSVISQALINAVEEKFLSRKKVKENNKDYVYYNNNK